MCTFSALESIELDLMKEENSCFYSLATCRFSADEPWNFKKYQLCYQIVFPSWTLTNHIVLKDQSIQKLRTMSQYFVIETRLNFGCRLCKNVYLRQFFIIMILESSALRNLYPAFTFNIQEMWPTFKFFHYTLAWLWCSQLF